MATSSYYARKTFELENEITNDDSIYIYNNQQQKDILEERPWKSDPNYFTSVRISAIALLRMAMHARSGKSIEVMGVMTGKIIDREFVVMDAYPLPVEGTETRVNALGEAYEYMVEYLKSLEDVGRPEHVVGWYHSHPGYGCWLSGIDVGTQFQNQQYQDPFLAIVVDPNRTISAGKVDIGAFRTYPKGYVTGNSGSGSSGGGEIPLAKLEDFGVHANKYYPLKISYFKSSLDSQILEVLWNKYWASTLAQSSLVVNHDYTTDQIGDLAARTNNLTAKTSHVPKSGIAGNEESSAVGGPHSRLFAERIRQLNLLIQSGATSLSRGKVVDETAKVKSENDLQREAKIAPVDEVTHRAVKIGSEELRGLISDEIKQSILYVTKSKFEIS